nr:EOG090X033O [Eulimnadia texana]
MKAGFYAVELNKTEWEVPERYQMLSPVGSGAYGQVCSAVDAITNTKVAIKKLARPFHSAIHAKRTYRELRMLKHMNHENVIGLLDVFSPSDSLATFQAKNYIRSLPPMKKKDFKVVFQGANPAAIDLLEKMLELDADKRLTAESALAHPYLAQYADPSDEPISPPYDQSFEDMELSGSGIGEPGLYHALVVIFLEFFAWGLLTTPMITVLNETFPDHTFLMNGIIMGIKGLLSFLSAPLVGALSDVWGRKFFLLVTVFFTCAPIPLIRINTWWYFAMISISGVFAVTFSVVFAYVADVTEESERSAAYGLVSATFAASLVTSPALGAYLARVYSETLVVAIATAVAILDVLFILVAVPESLPEKVRPSSWGAPISWEQADPFAALKKVGKDKTILMLCVTVFLSYLPEAGQYSCFFVYLRLVMGFSDEAVASFIAVVGVLSVFAQTAVLGLLMKAIGAKSTILVGLVFEMLQLAWYGFGSQTWMMWAAGVLAAVSSISYPAISAFVSTHADVDKQGLVQGMITGVRGLCNGLGPAVYGLIFYLFHVDLNDKESQLNSADVPRHTNATSHDDHQNVLPGPPFVFGSLLVVSAILVAFFIPEGPLGSHLKSNQRRSSLELPPIGVGHAQGADIPPSNSLSSTLNYTSDIFSRESPRPDTEIQQTARRNVVTVVVADDCEIYYYYYYYSYSNYSYDYYVYYDYYYFC